MLGKFACAAEKGLHPKHRLMNYHKFFVDNVSENDSVLDLGCGNGALSFDIAKKAKFVRAIDINELNIEFCRKKYEKENIAYILGDIENIVTEEKFDIVTLSNVLEHVGDRIGLLRKLSNISKKLIIRVPMLDRDWVTLYKKELDLPYLLDPTHKIEYVLDMFMDELKQGGFETEKHLIRFGEIWAVCLKR